MKTSMVSLLRPHSLGSGGRERACSKLSARNIPGAATVWMEHNEIRKGRREPPQVLLSVAGPVIDILDASLQQSCEVGILMMLSLSDK